MTTRCLWFELVSVEAFISYMDYRGETVRTLAGKCVVRDQTTGRTKTLSPATIGHLRSGKRKTCNPQTAKAVETALQAPSGLLFIPKVLGNYQRQQRLAQEDVAA